MKLPEKLKKKLKKEAKEFNMPFKKYVILLIETHQDRVRKFITIINKLI